jgi:parvulin-like peptidyl-prolyl isomerase
VITSQTFDRLYKDKLVRLGLSDNGDTRIGYLQNLVDDELMIAHAKRLGLNRTKKAHAERERIQTQELLNAYTEKHIVPAVIVNDDDLKELIVIMNTKVKVRHLYAPTKEKADSLYLLLQHGQSIDDLAKTVFTDPQLRNNGGSLGYISFDEMDPDFEKKAFSMNVGEISRPVKTVQGYSIIEVDDRFRNPLVTESEFAKAKGRLKAYVNKNKFEEAAKEFSAALRSRLDIRFNKQFIRRLYEIAHLRSWQHVIEQPSHTLSKRDLETEAVISSRGTWSGKELIQVLSGTAERPRKWIHTEENFEDYIAGLVMRDWIVNQARTEKLDAVPDYHQKVDFAFDTFLLQTLEAEMKNNLAFTSDSLQSYYAKNRQNFAIPAQIRLSSILVEDALMSDSVGQMLQHGSAFEELSKQFSTQRSTAENGGDMGYFYKNELGEFGNEIFALRTGDWKGPMGQEGKYLFVKCTERKDISYKSFSDCKEDIDKALREETWYRTKVAYIESLKREIPCSVFPAKLNTLVVSFPN